MSLMHGGSGSRIRQAASRTAAAGNARIATYTSFDGALPAASDARGVGVIDFANDRSQVTDRLMTGRMLEESDQRDSRLARGLKRAMSGSTELAFDGGRRYVRTDAHDWTSETRDPSVGRNPQDPAWTLGVLAGANDDVATVGDGDVRGTRTEHLRLTVDFHRARRETPGGLAMPDLVPRRRFRRGPSPSVPAVMPVEVWLDSAERLRRVSLAPLIHRADERVLWAVLELWDFGRAPAVMLPG
jgi:hypothetical protein